MGSLVVFVLMREGKSLRNSSVNKCSQIDLCHLHAISDLPVTFI